MSIGAEVLGFTAMNAVDTLMAGVGVAKTRSKGRGNNVLRRMR